MDSVNHYFIVINKTPNPLSLLSLSFSQINACAPMSIPLVGCEAINREGSSSNSRPTTNFCWFPPERAVAKVFVPGVLTSNNEIIFLHIVNDVLHLYIS